MAIKSSNKLDPNFNMSSLTDIIFLLIIFFMLTSTFVTPNALNVQLPSSNSQTTVKEYLSVTITRNLDYYVGQEQIGEADLKNTITKSLQDFENPTIILNAEKSVPIDNVVKIMNVAQSLGVNIVLATEKVN